jgi:hypothetical protein
MPAIALVVKREIAGLKNKPTVGRPLQLGHVALGGWRNEVILAPVTPSGIGDAGRDRLLAEAWQ